jgi:hypothetical protein
MTYVFNHSDPIIIKFKIFKLGVVIQVLNLLDQILSQPKSLFNTLAHIS